MFMNGEQMDIIRAKAGQLLGAYGEFALGDAKSKQVCPGYAVGYGTTCGFLCHFLMWRLGVKDPTRVKLERSITQSHDGGGRQHQAN